MLKLICVVAEYIALISFAILIKIFPDHAKMILIIYCGISFALIIALTVYAIIYVRKVDKE